MSSPKNVEPFQPAGQNPFVGIGFKIISALSFTVMGAFVKLVGATLTDGTTFPVGQVVFCRSFFALIPVFVWLGISRQLSTAFVTKNHRGHLRRGVIGSCGMFFGFAGLAYLPLPDATAISYAAPLVSVVLAALLLGETVRLYRWSAVLVGFCGVIIMLWPHISANALTTLGGADRAQGALFSLIGACCAAFAMIEVRRLTASETTASIVIFFSLMTTTLGTFTVIGGALDPRWAWVTPDAKQALYLVLVGVMGGIGQIFLTESYRRAPASLVAPFDYSSMIFAIGIGYVLFGTMPDQLVLIGAAIVSCAGIYVIWRERQLGIDRRKQGEAASNRAV